MGDQATFDGRSVGSSININTIRWGISVYGAGYNSPAQIDDVENHNTTIQPDGVHVVDNYGNPSSVVGQYDVRTTALRAGTGASRIGRLAGSIRKYDLDQGVIRHALKVALPWNLLRLGWVWPAAGQDATAVGNYAGYVPIGSRVAIPPNTPMPSGMSAAGQMIWRALRDYGAYVTDSTGASSGGAMMAEAVADTQVSPARNDMAKIWSQVHVVTNTTQTSPAGPGNRLAPLAP